jgi:hypothetical protein
MSPIYTAAESARAALSAGWKGFTSGVSQLANKVSLVATTLFQVARTWSKPHLDAAGKWIVGHNKWIAGGVGASLGLLFLATLALGKGEKPSGDAQGHPPEETKAV